jgi:hypothetical protein
LQTFLSAIERAEAKGEPLPGSFEAVAREWLVTVHRAKVIAGHADRTGVRFERDVFSTWTAPC